VVSAIGHETDETISDYVADVRAPTPSAAAELVVPDSGVLHRQLEMTATMMYRVLVDHNSRRRTDLTTITRRMEIGLPDTQTMRRRVDDAGRIVQSASAKLISEGKIQVEGVGLRFRALDPLATLNRGFAIVQLADSGKVVSSTRQILEGDLVEITVTDGSIPAVAGLAEIVEIKKTDTSKSKASQPKTRAKAKPVQPPGMAPLL
jgi:exodeoxyribonuclease VII large subunit